jgi:hypothetical protein
LQISGSLKRKVVDCYREDLNNFYSNVFQTNNISFSYDGELILHSSDSTQQRALYDRQETLINNGIDNTLNKAKDKGIDVDAVSFELDRTKETSRNMSFALFECFYSIVVNAKSSDDFRQKAYKFANFRDYLCSLGSFEQWELEIMINLFLRDLAYTPEKVTQEEKRIFGIETSRLPYPACLDEINLGKFIAPNRVRKIAPDLIECRGYINYIAPVYFALKNDVQAERFLKWCQVESRLDADKIIDKAELCKAPDNLIQLVREIDKRYELPF